MSKQLDEASSNIGDDLDKIDTTKNLCVHDLRRKLKERQKKANIRKVIILTIIIFFISFLSLYYSKIL